MDAITNFFASMDLDFYTFGKAALILLLTTLALSLVGRYAFGKRSTLSCAVSSAIAILFIYAVTVVLRSAGARFDFLITPLPFVSIDGTQLTLFSFTGAHYTAVCGQILSMIILAFLVNLADGWLPTGKNLLSWIFFRTLTVVIAYALHLVVVVLFAMLLPEGLVTYAPVVLLGILILMLLTGALKFLIGAVIGTVNPLIGGLYTFFFASLIGKQITKAVLSTALLSGLVFALEHVGVATISIAAAALAAYIPFLIILVLLWYLVTHIL